MTHALQSRLEDALTHMSGDLRQAGVDGHCDAFAIALMDHLMAAGEAQDSLGFIVISRDRTDNDGKVIDTNPFSHVVLEALGTTWDVCGQGADERWEADWIQPDEDEEAEDTFCFDNFSRAELVALRQERDGRDPDSEKIQAYGAWLNNAMRNPSPEEDPSTRRKRRPAG